MPKASVQLSRLNMPYSTLDSCSKFWESERSGSPRALCWPALSSSVASVVALESRATRVLSRHIVPVDGILTNLRRYR